MLTQKVCPACGAVHTVELQHQFKTEDHRKSLELILVSQSSQHDDAKLEWLVPYAPDGQELRVTPTRLDERRVLVTIERVPVTQPGKVVPAAGMRPRSRADLETEAAECGLKVDKKWSPEQLAQAIADHKAKLQPA